MGLLHGMIGQTLGHRQEAGRLFISNRGSLQWICRCGVALMREYLPKQAS